MRLLNPECANCGAQGKSIKLFWSTKNMMKIRIRTYYCETCAKCIVPKEDPIGVNQYEYPGET